jgi:hypothetical protein
MITLILFPLIGFFWVKRSYCPSGSDYFAGIFIGFIFSLFLAMVLAINVPKEISNTQEVRQYDLVSFNDSGQLDGRFFLGSGTVNESMYYRFYYEKGKGFNYNKIEANSVKNIYYDDDPRIIKYRITKKPKGLWSLMTFGFYDYYYLIYVPEGSIKRQFNLDLK